tara:strand:+ start:926 stop:2080 length:1155 start_codon:yes stop_codon:yes gene_type:complete
MDALFIYNIPMLQNKIYLNFFIEIIKTFLVILFGLTIIALTVRAVNFLDLIVESGYPPGIYFKYSFLNLFGIAPKFIPLAFLLALTLFILKHIQDSEFVILWTSGVKKIKIVNLFFYTSLLIFALYIFLSSLVTPLALNKSRLLLTKENLNSFLPTIKSSQFSDSFKGFTLIVDDKSNNELKNIFLHDKGDNIKNFSSNISKTQNTTIIAKNGMVEKKKMFLFNGQIITSSKDNSKNEIIKFEQLIIDLGDLTTTTIKKPKLQETSTLKLLNCLVKDTFDNQICKKDIKNEIIPTLSRRVVLPFYIPVISLICSLLLIKTKERYLNKYFVFTYSFVLLIFTEMAVRYTGINFFIKNFFILFPFLLFLIFYFFLNYKFSKETYTP